MSITVGTTAYSGTGPTKAGQVITQKPYSQEWAYLGYCPITLDGSATTATINFVDGTVALPFTPTNVLVGLSSPAGSTNSTDGIAVQANNITTTGFDIKLTGTGTNTKVLNVVFLAIK